ncbi:MAG: hypothetical protein C4547_10840 [Phycisphaerales bacterium]|nr:MAG: hypothetical protein C4547_10840 [Phycisphaerales bacterium]
MRRSGHGGINAFLTVSCAILCAGGAWAQGPSSVRPRLPEHVTPATVEAIDRGLAYLVGVQNRDGSWGNRMGLEAYPVAMTALSGFAFLMDGNTTTQGRYAPQVDRACRYILSSATSTGLIGREAVESRPMYGHGFSMLFLGELSGVVEDPRRQSEIQNVLRGAAQLASRSQSRLGGWLYSPDSRGDEGSVTITQLQGLRACRNSGVEVAKRTIDEAMDYLAVSQNSDGGIAYTASSPGPSRAPITAAAVACWLNAGLYDEPRMKRALAYAKRTILPSEPEQGHFYYAHLYMAQSVYVSNDPYWGDYFPRLRDRLLANQAPDGSWFGDGIGEVYGTAVALIILQLPYNCVPIMQR